MVNKYRIGVLFCGGCNCYFDREELYGDIRTALKEKCEFMYYSEDSKEDFDLILLINGCQSECLVGDEYTSKLLLINNKNCAQSVDLIKKELNL